MRSLIPSPTAWDFFCAAFLVDCCLLQALMPSKSTGMNLTRDSERMVLADLIYGAASPAGWALIEQPNDKERRFLKKLGIELIEANLQELLSETTADTAAG